MWVIMDILTFHESWSLNFSLEKLSLIKIPLELPLKEKKTRNKLFIESCDIDSIAADLLYTLIELFWVHNL